MEEGKEKFEAGNPTRKFKNKRKRPVVVGDSKGISLGFQTGQDQGVDDEAPSKMTEPIQLQTNYQKTDYHQLSDY